MTSATFSFFFSFFHPNKVLEKPLEQGFKKNSFFSNFSFDYFLLLGFNKAVAKTFWLCHWT